MEDKDKKYYDGTDRLCHAVYGRDAEARDYIGGSNAQMLYDAANLIDRLEKILSASTNEKGLTK